ncbi:hypothetical protein NCU16353 [Neurospora crassa OR74A]|uniref:Uncharacterized protein n=1 Tax=Neurospora crassa (strain ATCC 24698 / 74-OR23-1A / CBS 708.71 / DSM 1257 / FGSC 987) TaxID=367110 RepID=V5IQ88_NEUCR|nr:hypothetical protein NCU16353 [Neurospora crassa OR74A]ESA43880.1 hypothetical protein NCU16353 [Neurospora crassa OR74A]|eukprot:XP_011393355.1 hypothetical protein NCU16353 [Neurospora crassa OR74A]
MSTKRKMKRREKPNGRIEEEPIPKLPAWVTNEAIEQNLSVQRQGRDLTSRSQIVRSRTWETGHKEMRDQRFFAGYANLFLSDHKPKQTPEVGGRKTNRTNE